MKLIKNKWEVQQIHQSIAIPFVEQHHYARKTANTSVAVFGLFYKGDKDTLHGISWWMPPPLGASKFANPTNHSAVLGLSRFCLVDDRPENAGSFLISGSIQQLDQVKYRTLITYADTSLNHDGGLYRASNWSYTGLTTKQPSFWDVKKHCLTSRKKGPKTYTKAEMIAKGHKFLGMHRKHRFLYPLDRSAIVIQPRVKQLEFAFTKEGKAVVKNINK